MAPVQVEVGADGVAVLALAAGEGPVHVTAALEAGLGAALEGSALGAGLELALACHHRVLAERPAARLGCPEIHTGLLPRGGGAQRLARLLGIARALPILREGAALAPAAAHEAGLVDALVAPGAALEAARAWVLAHPAAAQPWDARGFTVPGGVGCLAPHAVESFQFGSARAMRATQRHYPAAPALLSALFEGTQLPFDTALRLDAQRFAQLLTDPVARNLLRTLALGRRDARRRLGRAADAPPTRLTRLGVIGADAAGRAIAERAVRAGLEVVLIGVSPEQAARGHAEIAARLAGLGPAAADALLARLTPATDYAALAGCELVIEAVFEFPMLKQQVLLRASLHSGAVLGSHSTTLSITRLAAACRQPGRLVGLHCLAPRAHGALLEIVRGRHSDAAAVTAALDLAARLGAVPIVVEDSPGRYTRRLADAFIDEGLAMLAEGIAPALIENAARRAGMPAGPLAAGDAAALEREWPVPEAAAGSRSLTAPDVVRAMQGAGRTGREAGAGFYAYPPGERPHLWPGLGDLFARAAVQPTVETLERRLLVIQALESVRCLEEGVIGSALEADLGAILGAGYPAWTGGTLSYVDTVGLPAFVAGCEALARHHGARFRPSAALRARAAAGRGFHAAAGAA